MRQDNPLERWLVTYRPDFHREDLASLQAKMREGLDNLERWLDQPPSGKRRSMDGVRFYTWNGIIGVAAEDVPRVQTLYRRVFETGGTGSTDVERDLLEILAATEDPGLIPFWVELLALRRPRDRFAADRRVLVLAALARMAAHHDEPAVHAALSQLLHHAQPEVRALAIYDMGMAYAAAQRLLAKDLAGEEGEFDGQGGDRLSLPEDFIAEQDQVAAQEGEVLALPEEFVDELNRIAMQDEDFLVRYQARALLRETGRQVPVDNPGGIYEFDVSVRWAPDFHCHIAARSENTLDDLHVAIQDAFQWDADHLYSFSMNGLPFDERFSIVCPYEEERSPWTDETLIGSLGLRPRQTFLYLFDYGDDHEFDVKVVDVRPNAGKGKYPRMVSHTGKRPQQYARWDV